MRDPRRSILPGLAAACLLLVPAAALQAKADGMLAVTCTPAPGVDEAAARDLCAEFLPVLASLLPGRAPLLGTDLPEGQDGLAIRVDAAVPASVGLQLTWHPAGKPPVAARPLAFSVMDRTLSAEMRLRFYRQLLADHPIPL